MTTILPPLRPSTRTGRPGWRDALHAAAVTALAELRRAVLASRRHQDLRDRLARRDSYLDVSRRVLREVYGDRLPPHAFWAPPDE
jgi:hypothetical protein